MKQETIDYRIIVKHPDYIRQRELPDHVLELAEALRDAGDKWIFPPIDIVPIPISEEKLHKDGMRYYVIDGYNRWTAATARKVPVVANVHTGLSREDIMLLQVKNNLHKGAIPLTDADRGTAFFKLNKEMKLTQEQIAKRAGLNQSTVSRILAGIIAKSKPGPSGGTKPFSAQNWFKALGRLAGQYAKHGSKIRKAKDWDKAIGEAIETITDCLAPKDAEGEK